MLKESILKSLSSIIFLLEKCLLAHFPMLKSLLHEAKNSLGVGATFILVKRSWRKERK